MSVDTKQILIDELTRLLNQAERLHQIDQDTASQELMKRREAEAKLETIREILLKGKPPLSEFLSFMAARLSSVYRESPNIDFVLTLQRYAQDFKDVIETNRWQ